MVAVIIIALTIIMVIVVVYCSPLRGEHEPQMVARKGDS